MVSLLVGAPHLEKRLAEHTVAAPKGCDKPTPSSSPSEPGLPVTGANVAGYALAGLVILALGGALLITLRVARRRIS